MTARTACFALAGLLYAVGVADVVMLGKFFKVNVALMLIALGTACLVGGIVAGIKPRASTSR